MAWGGFWKAGRGCGIGDLCDLCVGDWREAWGCCCLSPDQALLPTLLSLGQGSGARGQFSTKVDPPVQFFFIAKIFKLEV